MHRRTAPNHIHIFIRLISSDSSTFSRHGTFTLSLDKVSANDRPLYTQNGSNACIFNTDWLQILQPRLFRTSLHTSEPGHKGGYEKILTHQLQQSEWRTHPEMSRRLLQPQHSPPFWLIKFSSRSNCSTQLSDYQADTWRIYILYTIPLLFLFLCICLPAKTSAWHDISRIRWGKELKVSSFQIFITLSCFNTDIFYITWHLTSSYYPWRLILQRNSRLKRKATERFRISPSPHKNFLVISIASIKKNKSSVTSWCNSWD